MAERNALAVMNHPFIVRMVYSFQVEKVVCHKSTGFEQLVLCAGAVSLRNSLGPRKVCLCVVS